MSAFFTAVVIAFSPSNETPGASDVKVPVATRLSKRALVQRLEVAVALAGKPKILLSTSRLRA